MSRDQSFFDMYSLVIGVLAAISLGILVLAMKVSDRTQEVYKRESAEYKAAVAERIRPVGQVYLPGEEQLAAAPVVATVDEPEPVAATMSGPQVYNSACIACHGAGVAGAPITGEPGAVGATNRPGCRCLNDHAINGFSGSAWLHAGQRRSYGSVRRRCRRGRRIHGQRGRVTPRVRERRSKQRNDSASATCGGAIFLTRARSAIVRATFKMR